MAEMLQKRGFRLVELQDDIERDGQLASFAVAWAYGSESGLRSKILMRIAIGRSAQRVNSLPNTAVIAELRRILKVAEGRRTP